MQKKVKRRAFLFLEQEKVIDTVVPCWPLIGQNSERCIDKLIYALRLACSRNLDNSIFLLFVFFMHLRSRILSADFWFFMHFRISSIIWGIQTSYGRVKYEQVLLLTWLSNDGGVCVRWPSLSLEKSGLDCLETWWACGFVWVWVSNSKNFGRNRYLAQTIASKLYYGFLDPKKGLLMWKIEYFCLPLESSDL